MNLAKYEKLDLGNRGEFIKFEKTGDTKYLRFIYESGGNNMGEDVKFRRKYWDDEEKKFVYDTDKGQLVCALKCIEYDADGSNPKMRRWERSAYFCKNVLLPMWRNYPKIIDGVWKVAATSPKTIEASYALFPVMNADTIKFPIIDDAKKETKEEVTASVKKTSAAIEGEIVESGEPEPAPKKKKYWE